MGAVDNISVYDSSLTWFSLYDLGESPLQPYNFRITPFDNDPGTPATTFLFINNENLPPGANVSIADGEQTDTVEVELLLISPDIQPAQLLSQYSLDNGINWINATMFTPDMSENENFLIHLTYWLSQNDVPELDKDSLLFRFYYNDPDGNLTANYISDYFSIDNNSPPTVTFDSMSGEYSDYVSFSYQLADIANDTLSLEAMYSLDNGISWNDATIIDPYENLFGDAYSGEIRWDSAEDIEGVDAEDEFYFKFTPFDEDPGERFILNFHIDNNRVPSLFINEIGVEVSNLIEIEFNVNDPEDDSISYIYEFSIDSMNTWNNATISENNQQRLFSRDLYSNYPLATSDPSNRNLPSNDFGVANFNTTLQSTKIKRNNKSRNSTQSIYWSSYEDIPKAEIGNVYFRITPIDADTGESNISNPFRVDNWQEHRIILSDIEDEVEDSVSINYSIIDSTKDLLKIYFRYSTDGETFVLFDSVPDLGQSNYFGTYQWASRDFLENQDINNLVLSADLYDEWGSGISDTITFHLDNNYLPTVNILTNAQEISGVTTFDFEVINPEFEDFIQFSGNYSINNGLDWIDIPDSSITNFVFEGLGSSEWNTTHIFDGIDQDGVVFRLIPFDADQGIAGESLEMNIDNSHSHSVTLQNLDGEQTDQIPLLYVLDDILPRDSLALKLFYKLQGNSDWISFDTITGILPNVYSSQYFWDSAVDLDGIDDTVEVMAVPTDGWQDGIPDMISFHVDNNDVPEITFEPMSGEYSGNIILPFTLFNPESEDEITYEFQYFYNQWNIIQDSSISINNNYFSWNSRHYLDSLDIDNVQVLAFPLDNDVGLPDTTSSFSIDNVHSHTALFNPTDTGLENDQYSRNSSF